MARNDSVKKTLIVALGLCIVCSLVVSTAAVTLKPAQDANKALDRRSNILAAAGLLKDTDKSVEELFQLVETRIVDLETGEFTDAVEPGEYDQRRAARNPEMSKNLDNDEDIAGIGSRERYAEVYLVRREGELDKVILPVRGYGLWSTLYGFLALESDLNTIAGLGFFDHAETPGLGGEVDNPNWKEQWPGKQVYQDGEVEIRLIKGSVDPNSRDAEYKIDGLSGATLTSRGVTNLLHYWLGEQGYKPFLQNLKAGEA